MKPEEIKEIAEFCEKQNIEIEDLLSCIDDDFYVFEKIRNSIDAGYCSFENIIEKETIEDRDYYYYYEEYVFTEDSGIIPIEDADFCHYYESYYSKTYRVYIGHRSLYYSKDAIDHINGLMEWNGEFYDYEGLDYNGLCIDVNGDIRDKDDVYYWESDGEFHDEEEPKDDSYVREYHESGYQSVFFTENPKHFIGFEIEKEDEKIKESINICDFEKSVPIGWRKEKDASLNNRSGYELISPKYELNVDNIFEIIEGNNVLKNHINANYSLACGGHINISEEGLTGEEFFEKIKGYTPLIYALYYQRINTKFCKGKSNADLKEAKEKNQAIRIHSNRVEYRIISAVPDIETLNWRCRLMDFIVNNPKNCPEKVFFLFKTKMQSLIKEMYATEEELKELEVRIISYTLDFEKINIKK